MERYRGAVLVIKHYKTQLKFKGCGGYIKTYIVTLNDSEKGLIKEGRIVDKEQLLDITEEIGRACRIEVTKDKKMWITWMNLTRVDDIYRMIQESTNNMFSNVINIDARNKLM